jgi:ribose transport system permease protein
MSVATQPSPSAPAASARARELTGRLPAATWPFVVFAALFVLGGILRPNLFSLDSLWSTAAFAMILAIASSGQTLAIIQGGIDLSVANTITVSALTFLTEAHRGWAAALVIALAAGGAVGLLNGVVIARLGVSPIVMTIATNGLLFGIILLTFDFSQLTDTPAIITNVTSDKIHVLGTAIPAVIVLGLVLILALQLLLSRTGWGRSLYLVGAAPEMAELMGLPVQRIRIVGYVLSGVLAAFAGIVIAGYFAQTSVSMGDTYLLSSVAAVVVGGASIFGGSGSMVGTLGGALVLGQISTLVAVLNLGLNIQQLIYGAIILAVVALYGRRRADS